MISTAFVDIIFNINQSNYYIRLRFKLNKQRYLLSLMFNALILAFFLFFNLKKPSVYPAIEGINQWRSLALCP